MKTRIISACVGVPIMLLAIIFSFCIEFEIVIAIATALAVFEFLRAYKLVTNWFISIPSELIAILTPFFARALSQYMPYISWIIVISVLYTMYMLALGIFKKSEYELGLLAQILVFVLFITIGMSSLVYLRSLEGGMWFLLIPFLMAWIPDAGAYFIGTKYGQVHFLPEISPKKSIAGCLGGLGAGLIVMIIYCGIINLFSYYKANFLVAILIAVILVAAEMLGDLFASLIKRNNNLKDFADLIPGHGGIYDRFDSVISASIVMFAMTLIPFISNNFIK